MYGYVLQDWITIRGALTGAATSIVQGETGWLGLAAYQDIVFWLDVREFTLGGATNLTMTYETAPSKDDILFQAMATAVNLTTSPNPTVTKIILAQNPTVPLGRWVRWKLSTSNATTSTWDATFRILCCANAVGLAG